MIDNDTRLRFVKCIRSLSTEDAAMQLAEALEREWEERQSDLTPELDGLEQLPTWKHGDLLHWALGHPIPGAIQDASSVLVMREFRLIGDLARASEQAMAKGEIAHAQRIARALAKAWERIRGEQLLAMALLTMAVDVSEGGECD